MLVCICHGGTWSFLRSISCANKIVIFRYARILRRRGNEFYSEIKDYCNNLVSRPVTISSFLLSNFVVSVNVNWGVSLSAQEGPKIPRVESWNHEFY